MRLRPGLSALALLLPLLALAGPASAAGTSTWTGAVSGAWGVAGNWSGGVPAAGSDVVISDVGHATIVDVPTLQLHSLSVSGATPDSVSLAGPGTLSVTDGLTWTGGTIGVPLVLGGTSSIGAPGSLLHYGDEAADAITVTGTATITTRLELRFDSTLRVTGRLDLPAGAVLSGNRCCTNPTSTLVNQGTVTAASGSALLNLGLDQAGTVAVAPGARLELTGGPVRVHAGTVTGGGTLAVVSTSGAAPDPAHPDRPDGTLKLLGDLTLAGGSTRELGPGAVASGSGTVGGAGAVRLAGAELRGALTVVAPVAVTGARTRVSAGQTTLSAGASVAAGSTLAVHGGARLVVPAGRP